MAIVSQIHSTQFSSLEKIFPSELFQYIRDLQVPNSVIMKDFLNLDVGKKFERQLGSGLRAIEQCYMSGPKEKAIIESHKKYIDFQMLIEGEEFMEFCPISYLKEQESYNSEKDLIIYQESHPLHLLKMSPYDFAIFMPDDAHRSTLQINQAAIVRKLVLKIPV